MGANPVAGVIMGFFLFVFLFITMGLFCGGTRWVFLFYKKWYINIYNSITKECVIFVESDCWYRWVVLLSSLNRDFTKRKGYRFSYSFFAKV